MRKSRKTANLPISILNLPSKSSFIKTYSPSSQYELYLISGKKICVESYEVKVQKSKLFSNLQAYQWRHQTEFPIVKTRYVSIQPNKIQHPHIIQLLVYNEHCPIKLNRIYQMTIAQTLYILKQSLIGFQRLYNRFGSFQISQSMIALNQKGFCKVWLNQNFSLNSIPKLQTSEMKMIKSIQQLIQNHCQQTKASRRLFIKLRQCKTFLQALKQIQSFTNGSKIIVPTRLLINSSLKQIPQTSQINSREKLLKKQSLNQQSVRISVGSSRIKNLLEKPKQKFQTNTSKSSNIIPSQIKRFKSEDKIKIANMKVSDGQTAYTRNIKASNTGGIFSSPRNTIKEKTQTYTSKKKLPKWHWQEDFVMGQQQSEKNLDKKDKKQLSYSQAIIKVEDADSEISKKQINSRKFSANLNSPKFQNVFYKFNTNLVRKNQHEGYFAEFKSILDNDQSELATPATPSSNKSKKIYEQEDEQKYREQHTENIMKNNGWNGFFGFIDAPKELNQSFHQGQEQIVYRNQIKLEKLESIGKRAVAMSILPEQYEDIIDII